MELGVDVLREAALGRAAVPAEVAEVELVVLEAQEREGVLDRDLAQRGVDLVPLRLGVVELVEQPPALVGLLGVALVSSSQGIQGPPFLASGPWYPGLRGG